MNPLETNSASPDVSEKYSFISTARVVDVFKNHGWTPVKTCVVRTKSAEKRAYAKHMIEFENVAFPATAELGNSAPRLLLTNAHDGSASFVVRIGLFRLVCANGLVVGNGLIAPVRIRHVGYTDDAVTAAIKTLEANTEKLVSSVARLTQKPLNLAQRVTFAHAALALRYPKGNAPIAATQLLGVRRFEDDANDAWTVFNRIQEQLTRGGAWYTTTNRNGRTVNRTLRGVKAIDASVKLNAALWALAEVA